MGQLKDEAIKNETEDIQQFALTPSEVNYIKLLNLTLQFHTMGQKIISGFLYYVATTRLGYKDGVNLQFEFDFNKDDNLLTIKLLPDNITELPAAEPAPAAPAPEEPPKK